METSEEGGSQRVGGKGGRVGVKECRFLRGGEQWRRWRIKWREKKDNRKLKIAKKKKYEEKRKFRIDKKIIDG